jgi:hypothetical protein
MPTRVEVIANIDETIRDKTISDKIVNTEDADNRELIVDYIDQEVATKVSADDLGAVAFSNDYNDLENKPDLDAKQDVSNISTDVTTDGASNEKYPSVKAVKDYVDANVLPYRFWRAKINSSSVVSVLFDNIEFTSPTITNPSNGRIIITKTGFFTGLNMSKIEFLTETINNAGTPYVCILDSYSLTPNDAARLNIFDMAGGQPSTPNTTFTVEIRIYN